MSALTLAVGGMRCQRCAAAVEDALQAAPGVLAARVDFATQIARIEIDAQTDQARLVGLVRGLGYRAGAADGDAPPRVGPRLAVAAFFSMNSMLAAGLGYLDALPAGAAWWGSVASGIFAAPVVLYAGAGFFRGAVRGLRARRPGMDLLIALGVLAAVGLSIQRLAQGSAETWFEAAAMIITLQLVGRAIEGRARRRAVDAVQALLARAPSRLLDADGAPVALDAVRPGAIVQVSPGAPLAVDGIVVAGRSTVDKALLDGEPLPAPVAPGDVVAAGMVNGLGALRVRVTGAAGARRLDAIATAVGRLVASRNATQRLADRLAGWLVPVVLGLATLTWLLTPGSEATARAIAVLVIACPCALGLAIPLATAVAAGRAARAGVFFRDASVLERVAQIDAVVLDKTGTLTDGQPRITQITPAPGIDCAALVEAAVRAEQGIDHPLAHAIRALRPALTGAPARAVPGDGSAVDHAGARLRVGRAEWLRGLGVAVPAQDAAVHVAQDTRWLGSLTVGDPVRGEARATVDALAQRAPVWLLTGDAEAPARAVAERLGIERVHARCSPEEKAARVRALQAEGRRVMVVGDGLNDTPALAAADVGVAPGDATDAAAAVADVVLTRGTENLPLALSIAADARRAMRQNFVWALGYNAAALPLAMLGWATPAVAAGAMALSSLSVVLNAGRAARRG